MKLTIEKNREALKRYGHIRPASTRGGQICSVRCPGTHRTCTLKWGHSGPHVAHGAFRRVVAVWDEGPPGEKLREKEKASRRVVKRGPRVPGMRYARPPAQKRPTEVGLLESLRAFLAQVATRLPSLEESLFIVLGIVMVWFAIETSLRILGWK